MIFIASCVTLIIGEKMSEFKQDRRSKRTRSAIKIALLKLLKTKPYGEITVKELSELAGINRNSFYTHYSGVENIFDDLNEDVLFSCERIFSKYTYAEFRSDPYPLLKELGDALSTSRHYMEYLVFTGAPTGFLRKLKDSLCNKLYSVYLSERGDENPVVPYMFSFLVGGLFELYYRYFNEKSEVSLETLTVWAAEFMQRCIAVMSDIKRGQ